MVELHLKSDRFLDFVKKLEDRGSKAPLSLQYTINVNINNTPYILMVQTYKPNRVCILQALRNDNKDFEVITDHMVLYGLLNTALCFGFN